MKIRNMLYSLAVLLIPVCSMAGTLDLDRCAPVPDGIIEDAIASQGHSLLAEGAAWIGKTASERGIVGATWNKFGDKTAAFGLKLNKKGPVHGLLGAEVLAQKSDDKILEVNPDAGRWRLFASPTFDAFWLWQRANKWNAISSLDWISIPSNWSLIAGPSISAPTTKWKDWRIDTHIKFFVAFSVGIGSADEKK